MNLLPEPIKDFASTFARGLSDFKFDYIATTRMLPTIYIASVIFSAIAALFLVVSTWTENTWPARVLWTFIFAPAFFIASVTAWRVGLELCYALFRMALHVQEIHEELQKVSGTANDIATDIPRIQFWRSSSRRRRRKKSQQEQIEDE